jgi:hypothetical protein
LLLDVPAHRDVVSEAALLSLEAEFKTFMNDNVAQ